MNEDWQVVSTKREKRPKETSQIIIPKRSVAKVSSAIKSATISLPRRELANPGPNWPSTVTVCPTPPIFRNDKRITVATAGETPKSQQPGILQVRKESLTKSADTKIFNTPGIAESQPKAQKTPEKKIAAAPQKTKSVALFDLIVASKSKSKHPPTSTSSTHPLNPVLKPSPIDDFRPKQFVVKKKKKKLSIIKKRLLKERLRKHLRQRRENDDLLSLEGPQNSHLDSFEFRSMCLHNVINFEDLADEDEQREILNDAFRLGNEYPGLEIADISLDFEAEIVCIILTYSTAALASTAAAGLNGLVLGGQTISIQFCRLVNIPCEDHSDDLTENDSLAPQHHPSTRRFECGPLYAPAVAGAESPAAGWSKVKSFFSLSHVRGRDFDSTVHDDNFGVAGDITHASVAAYSAQPDSCMLVIRNLVFPGDVVDAEETMELLEDLQRLCNSSLDSHFAQSRQADKADKADLGSVWVECRRLQPATTDSAGLGDHALYSYLRSSSLNKAAGWTAAADPTLFLEYSSFELAVAAVQKLRGVVVAGQALHVSLYDYAAYLSGASSVDFVLETPLSSGQGDRAHRGHLDYEGRSGVEEREEGEEGQERDQGFEDEGESAPAQLVSKRVGLLLHQFVDSDQIIDEEEKNDIVQDICGILQPIASSPLPSTSSTSCLSESSHAQGRHHLSAACSFWFNTTKEQRQDRDDVDALEAEGRNKQEEESSPLLLLDLLVELPSLLHCWEAMNRLMGTVIAGGEVQADIVVFQDTSAASSSNEHKDKGGDSHEPLQPRGPLGPSGAKEVAPEAEIGFRTNLIYQRVHNINAVGAVVRVDGFVTAEDIEDVEETLDDLIAMKKDVVQLCGGFYSELLSASEENAATAAGDAPADSSRGFLCRASIHTGKEDEAIAEDRVGPADAELGGVSDGLLVDEQLPSHMSELVACVAFRTPDAAQAVMLHLDGSIVGGRRLSATVARYVPPNRVGGGSSDATAAASELQDLSGQQEGDCEDVNTGPDVAPPSLPLDIAQIAHSLPNKVEREAQAGNVAAKQPAAVGKKVSTPSVGEQLPATVVLSVDDPVNGALLRAERGAVPEDIPTQRDRNVIAMLPAATREEAAAAAAAPVSVSAAGELKVLPPASAGMRSNSLPAGNMGHDSQDHVRSTSRAAAAASFTGSAGGYKEGGEGGALESTEGKGAGVATGTGVPTVTGDSIYKEAKLAPKLGKHETVRRAIAVASEEISVEIVALLKALGGFQARLKEKDPIKAKTKARYVIGLKQVINGVKAERAKLVMLSPDTEASDALDDKVDVLVDAALEKEVPVIYCLSRRRIGKALGMSTRQSAVAIYDASGAFEHFKAIATFIACFDEAAATAAEAAEAAAAGEAVGDNAAAAAAATALSAPLPREPSVGGKVAAATAACSGPAHRSPGAIASERK